MARRGGEVETMNDLTTVEGILKFLENETNKHYESYKDGYDVNLDAEALAERYGVQAGIASVYWKIRTANDVKKSDDIDLTTVDGIVEWLIERKIYEEGVRNATNNCDHPSKESDCKVREKLLEQIIEAILVASKRKGD
jgi:hypothetical protein